MLTKDHNYEDGDSDTEGNFSGGSATDTELFAMLKDLRKNIAKKHNLPPFVIFSDPSLQDMAIQYPVTMDELTMVSGVGQGKAQKYGAESYNFV